MSRDTRRWRLVSYDIRDARRYRKAYKVIRGHGDRLQYSLYRCLLDDEETEALRWRLWKCLDPEDRLLVVDLCPRCATRLVARNDIEGEWDLEPPGFRIIQGQEPPDGVPDPD